MAANVPSTIDLTGVLLPNSTQPIYDSSEPAGNRGAGGGGGGVNVGDTISLTGGSWEAIASPQVAKQDAMQGTDGQDLTGWDLGSSHGVNPKYSSTNAWAGTTCARMDFTGSQYNCTAEFKALNDATQIYSSYRVRISKLAGVDSRNIKLQRITAGYSGGYLTPTLGVTLFDDSNSAIAYNYYQSGQEPNQEWVALPVYDQWVRIEHFIRLSSTQGAADGEVYTKYDGVTEMQFTNVVTNNETRSLNWVTLPYYVAHDAGGDYEMLVSDVFIGSNNGQARVEISNSAVYSASSAVPCNTTSRTASAADIVIPESPLDLGAALYAYVFDSDGTRHDYGAI